MIIHNNIFLTGLSIDFHNQVLKKKATNFLVICRDTTVINLTNQQIFKINNDTKYIVFYSIGKKHSESGRACFYSDKNCRQLLILYSDTL